MASLRAFPYLKEVFSSCVVLISALFVRPWVEVARLVLSDVREPTVTIVCQPCARRGRYNVASLIAQHADAKLPDLLQTLADFPKARSANIYDRCKAVYGRAVL
jgi:hypothetical protein